MTYGSCCFPAAKLLKCRALDRLGVSIWGAEIEMACPGRVKEWTDTVVREIEDQRKGPGAVATETVSRARRGYFTVSRGGS